ncbi:hypothetical protein JG688_00016867, partial [Phytophthora aleatoria]
FYGGSRGNPDRGGSGAAVVRLGATLATIHACWLVSISHASPTTTNNLAEHYGLRTKWPQCTSLKMNGIASSFT